jgi:hypothetical protein
MYIKVSVSTYVKYVISDQGDQIVRIFASWAIIYFWQFFKLQKRANFMLLISTEKVEY